MKTTTTTALRAALATGLIAALAGCSGGGGEDPAGNSGGGAPVEGGTFTLATASDIGNLDPHASAASSLFQFSAFAYDSLLALDAEAQLVPALASTWEVAGQEVRMTLTEGVACADGEPFTATDAADNINYVADPANQSPFLGVFLPAGASASAPDEQTLTITLAGPAPFALQGLSRLPMVCRSGLDDRSLLADGTRGTGPYALEEVVPGESYTLARHEGYAWGPDGATTETAGMPEQVVFQVVPDQTTTANLLLSGDLSAATVIGPDVDRLEGAGLFSAQESGLLGEMWFNHAAERPGADPVVRQALLQALDLEQLVSVLTSGQGEPATTFAIAPPVACPGDSVGPALPESDPAAAAQLLDDAGWAAGAGGVRARDGVPLAVTLLWTSELGTGGSAATELVAAAWQELGAEVTVSSQSSGAAQEVIFTPGGDWDVAWLALNVSSPDQLVPFLSGPGAPEGTNFAGVANADYEAGIAEAAALPGTEGCETWLAAEANLVEDADVVPFANQVLTTFGSGAEFELNGNLVPTSIRMVAS